VAKLKNKLPIRKIIEPAVAFFQKLQPKEQVTIVHAHDCDSICSAAILAKICEMKKVALKFVVTEFNHKVSDSDIAQIEKAKARNIIITDLPVIPEEKLNDKNVLVVDHHGPAKYKKFNYVNPLLHVKNVYLPTTYIALKIFENFSQDKHILWIAGIGVLADHGVKECLDLFKEIEKKFPELTSGAELTDENLFEESLLGKLTRMCDSVRIVFGKTGASRVVEKLVAAKHYNQILADPKMNECYRIVKTEFNKLIEDFEKNKKLVKHNILFYEISSQLKLGSSLAGYLQKFYPNKIIIVADTSGDFCNLHIRKGNKVKTNLKILVKKGIKNIPNSEGGGHPAAVGARFPKEFLNYFLQNIS
jgi:single-stranded DNA-specific DHH superfamily exonuclease